jgi:hypothetical protein
MEYGSMIRQAWNITWRYRFLWLLGVLAGGAVGVPGMGGGGGGGTGWRAQGRDLERIDVSLSGAAQLLGTWISANTGLLVALALIGVAIFLILIVLSFVAQGGMAQATADLATGQPSSLRRAWSAGVRLFWRFVGLWLVVAGAAVAIAAVIGAVVAASMLAFATGQPALGVSIASLAGAAVMVGFVVFVLRTAANATVPRWLLGLAAALFAVPIFTVLLVVALTVSIVVAFAQRAIVVEDIGPLAALRSGWQLARSHLGESLLTWLVNLGLALATGIAAVVGVLGALVLLAGLGALVVSVAGFGATTLVYLSIAGIVFVAGVLTLAGVVNSFFWTFWTLAYLRLSGRTLSTPVAA